MSLTRETFIKLHHTEHANTDYEINSDPVHSRPEPSTLPETNYQLPRTASAAAVTAQPSPLPSNDFLFYPPASGASSSRRMPTTQGLYTSRRVAPTQDLSSNGVSLSNLYSGLGEVALGEPEPGPSQRPKKGSRITRTEKVPLGVIGQPLPCESLELPLPHYCPKCSAKKFAYESLHFCCGDGEVELASSDYPPELVRLFTSQDEDALHFRKYARLYNNMFAFSSLGGAIDAKTHKGIYVFKLHGQIYQYIPDLIPDNDNPKYLQLYCYDAQHEAENRLGCFPELREDIINILMNITQKNPYARFFSLPKEIEINDNTQIVVNKHTIPDQRVYNAPTSDEVTVILPDATSSSESSSPHILVSDKSNESHRIMHYYGCYDPLQYPLLFPCGDCGWNQGLKRMSTGGQRQLSVQQDPIMSCVVHTAEDLLSHEDLRMFCLLCLQSYTWHVLSRMLIITNCLYLVGATESCPKADKHISCRDYYSYKLQSRPNNLLLRAGRCLQQYIVDMYVKIENTRLDFFRKNQDTIRADLYQGILDTVESGENNAANVGRRVVLPPTFIGGPRDLKRRYLNAMALVQRYGKPDLFVTMTCNVNWPEIKQELAVGEEAQNRPDLVSRIFRAKLLALKKQIMEKHVFGEVTTMIYVVEFQKRGLPHAHFLIILKPAFKIKSPADYDRFVCAELPPIESPRLRKIILKHMMHGPCGHLNPQCPCMKHQGSVNHCKYGYPKKFCVQTTNSLDGYPLYRRRDTGETFPIRRAALDNRWVIPYNPYLSSLFDCHLNVEVCSSIQAVKYLYKYVYKGHDRISFNVVQDGEQRPVDKIDQYQSGRWVSPCEAAWRVFGFDLYEMHPAVLPLQIHLPNMQQIQIRPYEQLDVVLANEKRSRTPLTEFFKANAATPDGTGYLYGQFTEKCRWDASAKEWLQRKNKTVVVGRLAFVAPAEGERYFLRLLLVHVRSPKSFEDLLTVDGYRCATFQEAALKRGLLEEDDAVDLCLAEACEVKMPAALRRLFATILIFCQPSDPNAMWLKYYAALSENYKHQFPDSESKVKQLTARSVEQYLEAMGKSLKAFGLEHLNEAQDAEITRTKDILDALDAPIPEHCITCRGSLNPAQQLAFDCIIDHVKQKKPGAFFIDGPGGTGKMFLYNALYAEVRLMDKIVLATATSGIAAANIPSGRTAHSRFKIPIDIDASLACDIPKQGSLAALIQETTLIIWDEASMARKENVESLDLLLRDLCDEKLLFGGKLIVFGGDFRQVLPVVPRQTQREAVAVSLVSSGIWPQLTKFRLTENIRARDDPEFSAFLLALGNGELQTVNKNFVQLPSKVVRHVEDGTDPITELSALIFPEFDSNSFSLDIFTTRAILTPMNDDVDTINTDLIQQFPGQAVVYKSFDTMLDDNCNVYPTEFINTLCPGGMSPHELILKEGSPVILLRNLLPSSGLCNGTRMICKRFFPNLIECVIITGHHERKHVFIPRIKLRPAASSKYPILFQRKKFPIKLSFAMTINKSQGQTLSQVAIYLPRPCFSHGKLCAVSFCLIVAAQQYLHSKCTCYYLENLPCIAGHAEVYILATPQIYKDEMFDKIVDAFSFVVILLDTNAEEMSLLQLYVYKSTCKLVLSVYA
ncbi:uncharacterized protein [Spinacia oleracea]|uniref:ATP-dependent DNA helicase n=1 Tax=Spinacia oleracea TaxID=3562 RepID=A0ABM3RHC0_SPIOL|nr:uncharacterized protein LOC110804751 [Spinacia oleracea]